MPVVQRTSTAATPVQVQQPKIEPKDYKGIVVDGNEVPLTSLIAFVAGSPWTVDYYSQLVTEHTDLREQDPGQSGVYQQYKKIDGLELRVNTPLTSSQDTNTSLMTVTGSATIYPFLIPNVGDMFVADAADGGKAIFSVTNTERKSLATGSAFGIDYHLLCYVDAHPERLADLEAKSNETLYFDKDRVMDGLSPVLSTEDRQYTNDLRGVVQTLVRFYFSTFFNKDTGTLVLPGQSSYIYDFFVVDYMLKLVNSTDAPEIRKIVNMGSGLDPYLEQPQFWTALMERDKSLLDRCNTKMGLLDTYFLASNPLVRGYRFSKMSAIIYPFSPDTTVTDEIEPSDGVRPMTELAETAGKNAGLSGYLNNMYTEHNKQIPFIKRTLADDYYVLSSAFYNDTSEQSILESLTMDYLEGNALNRDRLVALCGNYHKWGRLDQFYFLPILITLVKTANNEVY